MTDADQWDDLDRYPDLEHRAVEAMTGGTPMAATTSRTIWSAAALLAADFPEPRWAVPGLIAEGLTLLVGAPKVGKSWLALGLAVSSALGGPALGRLRTDPGDVLYLALEDPPRRLQQRLRMVLTDDDAVPERLTMVTQWPADGTGFDVVRGWLADNPDARIVLVDVLARTRRPAVTGQSVYERDYSAVAEWKAIADDHGVAVVLVHHTRKQDADDYVDTVSGSHGLAGAADAVLVLTRSRGSADATLNVTGRDIEEAQLALNFHAGTGTWNLLDGPASDYELGDTRRDVVHLLRDAGHSMRPKEIAKALDADYELVKKTVQRMVIADQLCTDGAGRYSVPPVLVSLLSPVSLNGAGEGHQGHEGQPDEDLR